MIRTGIGYDVHQLVPGRNLVLGGVHIPFGVGLDGHSDADVLLHAIADALLGAAALGDIGTHFPPSDPAFKDANSLDLLARVKTILDHAGCTIHNLDASLIAEAPKIAPYASEMRSNIATALGLAHNRVSVKATTNERMGFVGRQEGMAAIAIATLSSAETP